MKKYQEAMEPEAWDALMQELMRRRGLALTRVADRARGGTIEQARYDAGYLDALDVVVMLLEGRNQ